MTQPREPDDRGLDRTLRAFNRRISRLEDTQVTWGELNNSFDRVYEEIDDLQAEMNERFDRLEGRFDGIEARFAELERKFDIVMRHITGEGS